MWVHNLSPFLLQFGDSFGIRWYGLAYLTGFLLGGVFVHFMARRGAATIKSDDIMDFVTHVIFGCMIGGRVGYALFYSPDLLTTFGGPFPYWDLLRVWEGGMASHGGILGILLACVVFAKKKNLDWRHLGDMTVVGGSIGIFFGRLANFMNGELFGRAASETNTWAMKFPNEMHLWLRAGPNGQLPEDAAQKIQQLFEAVKAWGGIDMLEWNRLVSTFTTNFTGRGQITNVINGLILSIQNGNEAVRAAVGQLLTPRYPSQLYEAVLEGLVLFIIALAIWYKPRKPGVVGSIWFTSYAVTRIIGEQFRMPDADIGFQALGLTRGQWLSVGMLAMGLFFWIWTARRPVPVISGWGPQAVAQKQK